VTKKDFFLGKGILRIWYILFYLLGLPLYLLGLFLFSQLKSGQEPQGGEFFLSILAIGYLILGLFSMINTILYLQKTKKYIQSISFFLGFQIIFWMIGYVLDNNYFLLLIFFLLSFIGAVVLNLYALSKVQKNTLHSSEN